MQSSDIKQRKKTSDTKLNGEKRKAEEKDEKKIETAGEENKSTTQTGCDVKLMLSLMSLALSVILMWIVHEQNSRFTEMKKQYDDLYKTTRSVVDLQSHLSSVSDKLQYDEILSSMTLMMKLRHDITSIHDTATALLEDQEASMLQYETLKKRFQNATETSQSRLATTTGELKALKSDSRSTHTRVTNHVNTVEDRLLILSERLQDLQDGIRRNTRVFDRTEEEDAGRVQDLQDWNTRHFSKLQERVRLASDLKDKLQKRLEETAPRVQRWEKRLPDVEESVRSMLKIRAQLSHIQRRITQLTLQVQTTQDQISSRN